MTGTNANQKYIERTRAELLCRRNSGHWVVADRYGTVRYIISLFQHNAGFSRAVRAVQNAIKWSAAEWHFGQRVLRRMQAIVSLMRALRMLYFEVQQLRLQ